MKGPIFWGMVAVCILAATAILIGARHEEYNRYEFHAAANNDRIAGYRMDKRTGEIVLINGKTVIATEWIDPYAEFSRTDSYKGVAVPDKTKR
jgi:hypothetical protein